MKDYSKGRTPEELEPLYPNQILTHGIVTFLLVSAIMLGVVFIPESFQKATEEFASYQTRPPWFLLPFYQLSYMVNSNVWFVVVLAIYAIVFISVPVIDRKSERSLWKKPIFLFIVIVNLSMIIVLGLSYLTKSF